MENTGNYKIVKSQLPLLGGIAGHNFIAVLDPNNRVIHELNGLATSKDGEIKPIGYLPSDKLYVYNEKEVKGFFYNSSQNQEVVFEGNYKDVYNIVAVFSDIDKPVNSVDTTYMYKIVEDLELQRKTIELRKEFVRGEMDKIQNRKDLIVDERSQLNENKYRAIISLDLDNMGKFSQKEIKKIKIKKMKALQACRYKRTHKAEYQFTAQFERILCACLP